MLLGDFGDFENVVPALRVQSVRALSFFPKGVEVSLEWGSGA
jgi:hypothetical protein